MYVKSLKILCPWFFTLNHHLYARWASVHICDIETLEESGSDLIEEFAQGNFVVTKSRNRFSAIALDQNHEQCNATLNPFHSMIPKWGSFFASSFLLHLWARVD